MACCRKIRTDRDLQGVLTAQTRRVNESDRPDLLRLWLEFDLAGRRPGPAAPGTVTLDGGDPLWRALSLGVGVTGYDEADCLTLVETWASSPLPPVKTLTRDPDPDDLPVTTGGSVMVWRGVWFPSGNLGSGPLILGRT